MEQHRIKSADAILAVLQHSDTTPKAETQLVQMKKVATAAKLSLIGAGDKSQTMQNEQTLAAIVSARHRYDGLEATGDPQSLAYVKPSVDYDTRLQSILDAKAQSTGQLAFAGTLYEWMKTRHAALASLTNQGFESPQRTTVAFLELESETQTLDFNQGIHPLWGEWAPAAFRSTSSDLSMTEDAEDLSATDELEKASQVDRGLEELRLRNRLLSIQQLRRLGYGSQQEVKDAEGQLLDANATKEETRISLQKRKLDFQITRPILRSLLGK